jgi:Flp pilus assembly protein TadD
MTHFRPLLLGFLAILCLGGCSLPRIIVLNDPLDARQHNDLGVSYQQRGESDLAIREYDRAAKLEPQWARPLINRGNVRAEQNDWRQAAKSYRQALRREPGNAEAMNNLAWVLLQAEAAGEALAWAEKAVAADPHEPAYLDTLAEIRIVRHDHEGARQAIAEALALDPPEELQRGLEQKRALLDSSSARP